MFPLGIEERLIPTMGSERGQVLIPGVEKWWGAPR